MYSYIHSYIYAYIHLFVIYIFYSFTVVYTIRGRWKSPKSVVITYSNFFRSECLLINRQHSQNGAKKVFLPYYAAQKQLIVQQFKTEGKLR